MTDTTEIVLFDGGPLDGWTMAGDGEFVVVDGALETRGGMGLLWYSTRRFRDFVVHAEWRTATPSDNGGLFVRFPDPQGDPWSAVERGYEIQILDDADDPTERTGAVYTFAGPDETRSHGPGRWNRLEVRAAGQDYTISINGRVVTRFRGDRGEVGHIGLQNHDDTSRVQYRNLRVRELAPS